MIFFWLQLGLALLVFGIASERLYRVAVVAPVSARALAELERLLRDQQTEGAQRLAQLLPRRWASRVVLNAYAKEPEEPEFLLLDLFEEAGLRLGMLRLSATLASTLGLLGGILVIRSGFGGDVGLLGLEAGLVQRTALGRALLTMSVGVGTAAFAFAAHAAIRRASRAAYAQAQRIDRFLSVLGRPKHDFSRSISLPSDAD